MAQNREKYKKNLKKIDRAMAFGIKKVLFNQKWYT